MQELIIRIKESHYKLFLQFLQTLEYVSIVKPSADKQGNPQFDFSDIAGKLEWQCDALVQQRLLRDEW